MMKDDVCLELVLLYERVTLNQKGFSHILLHKAVYVLREKFGCAAQSG